MRFCSKCLTEKDESEFMRDTRVRSGLTRQCAACISAYKAAWKAQRIDEYRAKDRARKFQPGYAEKIRVYQRARYEANKEAERAKARQQYAARMARWKAEGVKPPRYGGLEHRKNYIAQWAKDNRAKRAVTEANRRAAKVQNTPSWADQTKIAEFYETADGLSMLTGAWYHVDHIVPLRGKTVCGLHCEANLQVLPGLENIGKGNRHWPDQP